MRIDERIALYIEGKWKEDCNREEDKKVDCKEEDG